MASSSAPPQYPGDLYGQQLVDYIQKHAANQSTATVAIAVARTEGGFQGAVGDSGTSFGPWQLHVGGKLPAKYTTPDSAAKFANSPGGIDYALSGLNESISKLTGGGDTSTVDLKQATWQVVNDFERPKNPLNEYATAATYLGKPLTAADLASGSSGTISPMPWDSAFWTSPFTSQGGGVGGQVTTAAGQAVGSVVSAYKDVTGFLGWISNPKNILRILEVISGVALAFLGLLMLGKSTGVPTNVKGLVG